MIERVYMPFLPHSTAIVMYGLFLVALVLFCYGVNTQIKLLGITPKNLIKEVLVKFKNDPGKTWRGIVENVLFQAKTRESSIGNLMHSPLFFGFVALLIGTTIVAIDEDILVKLGDFKLLRGSAYLVFEIVLDAAGLFLLLGVLVAFFRRLLVKPTYLQTDSADYLALCLLFFIIASGFIVEGLRLAFAPVAYAHYSFVGNVLATALFNDLHSKWSGLPYAFLWYSHFVAGLAFIAIIPYTKFKHILLIPFNVIINPPKDIQDKAKLSTPFNILEIDEDAEEETGTLSEVGVGNVKDLEWSERLQVNSCINCGRCENVCPAHNSGRVLSPRNILQKVMREIAAGESARELFEEVVSKEEMWGCTNCYACTEVCPSFIRHVDRFIDFRRFIVNDSLDDETKIGVFENIERNGNPYGLPSYSRVEWLEDKGIPTVAEKDDFEYLYFIGCSSCYDQRCRNVTDSVIAILEAASIDYVILGEEERCCGEPAKRMGEEGLFQMTALQNIELWESYGISKILVSCPHCFNMLKHEYREFNGDYEVVHHTELIDSLIRERKLDLARTEQGQEITYHDPCNLGRLNGIFEQPRSIIESVGGTLKEMDRNKNMSFCCGAGAGNAFYRVPEETRISRIRVEEALQTKAPVIAAACPFCINMFEDVKGDIAKGIEAPQILDIAEIVARNLKGVASAD
ncbi:MAG: heterodisulfide reductase-related iron-sulfur binding cluster [Desulfuromonadales bacterium]|nr:heterodisulfide reductase-related iron-sulfur binding cluster [Desulfuromonadales bacterium]